MELNKVAIPCLFALLLLVPLGSAASVTRSISPATVQPGGEVTVTLSVDVSGAKDFYAIDDVYPSGFTVTDEGSGSTEHSGHWKHVVISGATNTEYTYTMEAPMEEGTYTFGPNAEYMFGGMEDTVPISGMSTISVSTATALGIEWIAGAAVILALGVAGYMYMQKKPRKK